MHIRSWPSQVALWQRLREHTQSWHTALSQKSQQHPAAMRLLAALLLLAGMAPCISPPASWP